MPELFYRTEQRPCPEDSRAAFAHEAEAAACCAEFGISKAEGATLYEEWHGLSAGGFRIPLRQFFARRTGRERSRFRVEADAGFVNVRRLVHRR